MIALPIAERYDALYGEPMPHGISREGVMIHFDGSRSDAGGIRYLRTASKGYTWAVGDDGRIYQLEPPTLKTPHAGSCRTANANSVFYGACALTDEYHPVTEAQAESLAMIVAACWIHHRGRWGEPSTANIRKRVRGHHEEAIWKAHDLDNAGITDPARRAQLLGKGDRKIDPRGRDEGPVILDMDAFRLRCLTRLERVLAAPLPVPPPPTPGARP